MHLPRLKQRRYAKYCRYANDERRALQPDVLYACSRFIFVGLMVNYVLSPAQEHRRKHRHHRDETDEQAAAADDAHFLDALEIRERHRQKRACRRQCAGENPLACIYHGFRQRLLRRFSVAQFLFVTRDQMHAVINRQSDEHRYKHDCQDVQMADGQRCERERVAKSDHQADCCFHRTSGFVIAINENQRAQDQRQNAGERGVLLRLRHLVVIQHRLARDADVDAGHFNFRLPDQFAQPVNRMAVEVILSFRRICFKCRRMRCQQKNPALRKRDVIS